MSKIKRFIKKYRLNSILFRYFIEIFLVLLMLFVVLLFIVYNNSKKDVIKDICLESQNKSNLSMQITDNIFKEIDYISANISNSLNFKLYMNKRERILETDDFERNVSLMLSSYSVVSKYIDSIYVYSSENNYVCASSGGNAFEKFNDTDWYNKYCSIGNEPEIYARYINGSYPLVISYIKRFKNTGAIIINIDVDEYNRMIKGLGGMPSSMMITEDDGNVLYSDNNDEIGKPGSEIALRALISHDELGSKIKYNHDIYAVGNTRSEYYEWNYLSIINTEYADERFSEIRYYVGLIFLSFIFIGIIISLLYGILSSNVIFSLVDMVDNTNNISFKNLKENEIKYLSTRIIKIIEDNQVLKNQLSEQFEKCEIYKMNTLQQQINPHFINNTLNCINYELIYKLGEEDLSVQSVVLLTRLIGYCFKEGTSSSTLIREVEFLNIYVDFLKMRYGNFSFEISIEKELYELKLPRLFLQPFVENSVYYGIDGKEEGKVSVSCFREDGKTAISIYDNGIGMSEEKIAHIYESFDKESFDGRNIGIRNSYCRLRIFYNQNTSIKIESDGSNFTRITIYIFEI